MQLSFKLILQMKKAQSMMIFVLKCSLKMLHVETIGKEWSFLKMNGN